MGFDDFASGRSTRSLKHGSAENKNERPGNFGGSDSLKLFPHTERHSAVAEPYVRVLGLGAWAYAIHGGGRGARRAAGVSVCIWKRKPGRKQIIN